jgi:hypothetical protein
MSNFKQSPKIQLLSWDSRPATQGAVRRMGPKQGKRCSVTESSWKGSHQTQ